MDAAQQPPAAHLHLNVVHAFPCGLRTWTVSSPQHESGDHLHKKTKAERAAPHVAPARPARNVLVQRGVHERAKAGAVIEPTEELLHPSGFLSAIPAWNRSYSTSTSLVPPLSSSSTFSGSSPRRLGPNSFSPSFANPLLWQGHSKRLFAASYSTAQPRCGHVAENAVTLFGSLFERLRNTTPTRWAGKCVQASATSLITVNGRGVPSAG